VTCAHCNATLHDGKFYVLNFGTLRAGENGTSPIAKNGFPAGIFFSLCVHDHDMHEPNGCSYIELTDEYLPQRLQVELYFCSKRCLSDWFATRVGRLSDLSE